MTLIKSISGIRGTIGGIPGENLTPLDIVECTAAYGQWLLGTQNTPRVVVGKDGRISGPQVSELAINTLLMMGIDVIDLGYSTTPTVEMAVIHHQAGGGIIFTASHNPKNWNALKFLNNRGEFISASTGQDILEKVKNEEYSFSDVDQIGERIIDDQAIKRHIDEILQLSTVDKVGIRNKNFKIVVDCINSTGAISVLPLLEKLGCEVILIHDDMHGDFAHNPEPLADHLGDLADRVISEGADLGIAVDPDVDRLAFMTEEGEMFGEEYTLVAVADYILSKVKGATVSNLSSTRALKDVTEKHGHHYYASAVGEVNVVNLMKEKSAVIGGEGNGGIIYPNLHFGRDALVGIALFLSLLTERNVSVSALRKTYPHYEMIKDKIPLTSALDVDQLLIAIEEKYSEYPVNTIDGVKIDFPEGWVHLRKSNTEPILRVYAEAGNQEKAALLINQVNENITELI